MVIQTRQEAIYVAHVRQHTINGLFLLPLDENHYLTELENNMIARNLIFQYIYCLKKSRWTATKKKMISVPVTQDSVINTLKQLPRLPSEAGLIEVGFKRKLEYNHSHMQAVIDVNKIFEVLEFLKASGHPYYQDFDDFETFKNRCMEQEEQCNAMLFNQLVCNTLVPSLLINFSDSYIFNVSKHVSYQE